MLIVPVRRCGTCLAGCAACFVCQPIGLVCQAHERELLLVGQRGHVLPLKVLDCVVAVVLQEATLTCATHLLRRRSKLCCDIRGAHGGGQAIAIHDLLQAAGTALF